MAIVRPVRAAVLGAGILGSTTALLLARQGVQVTLVDREHEPMRRASLVNEGKIHLGFVYGHDTTRATADTMLEGAVHFTPILRDLLGPAMDAVDVSRPFTYLIARDSMVAPDALLEHYDHVYRTLADRMLNDSTLDYLGSRALRPLRTLSYDEVAALVPSGLAAAAVETPERSVSTWDLASLVAEAVRNADGVDFEPGVAVEAVERSAAGFVVRGQRDGEAVMVRADQVVNCLWDGRLVVDATMDVAPPRQWTYRRKYRVLFNARTMASGQPSITIALGAYGDVVRHDRGDIGYASWYPECLQGWSTELAPPDSWMTSADSEQPDTVDHAMLAKRTLVALDEWCPGIAATEVLDVASGVIMAWGESDIVEHTSRLHRRDELGVWSYDGYHTVETGKFTCAPLMARRVATAVCDGSASWGQGRRRTAPQ